MSFTLCLCHRGEVREQKDCVALLQEILVFCFQQSVSLSCFKQCSYESTPRSILHSLFYLPVSYSTPSEQKIHFQKPCKCFNDECNRILLPLPLWQGKYIQGCIGLYQSFLFFSITATLLCFLTACHFSFHKVFCFCFSLFIYLSSFHSSGLQKAIQLDVLSLSAYVTVIVPVGLQKTRKNMLRSVN